MNAVVASNKAVTKRKEAQRIGRASYGVSIAGIVITVIVAGILIGIYFGVVNKRASWDVNRCAYLKNNQCYNHRSYSYSSLSCPSIGGYYSSDGYCYYD